MRGARLALLLGLAVPAAAQTPDVMFVPTNIDVVVGMLRLAGVTPADVVYDLGSGDGRLVIAAAKRFGARGVGIEIDASLVAEAARNADTAGVAQRVTFRRADLFQADLREATVVTLYLTPSLNLRLRPRLLRELRPGARVVSNNFDMGDWPADSTVTVQGVAMANTPVRLWIIPADVSGRWRVSAGDGASFQIELEQRFQQVSGTTAIEGRRQALSQATVRGDSISFTVSGRGAFSGRVAGDRASGALLVGGAAAPRPWRAERTAR